MDLKAQLLDQERRHHEELVSTERRVRKVSKQNIKQNETKSPGTPLPSLSLYMNEHLSRGIAGAQRGLSSNSEPLLVTKIRESVTHFVFLYWLLLSMESTAIGSQRLNTPSSSRLPPQCFATKLTKSDLLFVNSFWSAHYTLGWPLQNPAEPPSPQKLSKPAGNRFSPATQRGY
jgi:hypothetical protein